MFLIFSQALNEGSSPTVLKRSAFFTSSRESFSVKDSRFPLIDSDFESLELAREDLLFSLEGVEILLFSIPELVLNLFTPAVLILPIPEDFFFF